MSFVDIYTPPAKQPLVYYALFTTPRCRRRCRLRDAAGALREWLRLYLRIEDAHAACRFTVYAADDATPPYDER